MWALAKQKEEWIYFSPSMSLYQVHMHAREIGALCTEWPCTHLYKNQPDESNVWYSRNNMTCLEGAGQVLGSAISQPRYSLSNNPLSAIFAYRAAESRHLGRPMTPTKLESLFYFAWVFLINLLEVFWAIIFFWNVQKKPYNTQS